MRYRLLFCMGLALFCACQKQEFDLPGNDDYGIPPSGEKKEIIISATLADTAPETRTELERVVENGVTTNHIYWLPGDQIAIFSAGEESVFTAQNTERALKEGKVKKPVIPGESIPIEITLNTESPMATPRLHRYSPMSLLYNQGKREVLLTTSLLP